jgi:predicted phage terminase large subunit-like protein
VPDSSLIEIDRKLGQSSFTDFVKICWPWVVNDPLEWNWHLDLKCAVYTACLRGEIKSVVINEPPGCSKSIFTSVFFPAWAWVQQPGLRWIFASCDQTLVNRDARMCLDLMMSKEFQQRWGHRVSFPKRVQAIEEIHNSGLGWRIGTTPGGKAIGWHAHFQVFDDLIKPAELTPVTLKAVEDWRSETMATRWLPEPALNCRIIIAQRLHDDDPPAHELAEGAEHVMLPMEFDPERKCITRWGEDQRTVAGELLHERRFPRPRVDALRIKLGPVAAAAQLDQNPAPKGGLIFTNDDLAQTWAVMPPEFHQIIFSWDCTFKETSDSDFVVGQVWGRLGVCFYLLDRVRGQMGFWDTLSAIKGLKERWPNVIGLLIEDKANGTAIIETLQKTIPGVIPVNPSGGKEARANAVSPLFRAKNVFLPANAPWLEEYRMEMKRFPRGRRDDQVDATTQALLYLQLNTHYLSGLTAALGGLTMKQAAATLGLPIGATVV